MRVLLLLAAALALAGVAAAAPGGSGEGGGRGIFSIFGASKRSRELLQSERGGCLVAELHFGYRMWPIQLALQAAVLTAVLRS